MELFSHYKDFLLNAFIVTVPIAFYQYTFRENKWLRTLSLYLLFCVPLFLTMLFPIRMNETVHDLRAIPFAIGSLYGGVFTSLSLFFSLIFFRYLVGGIDNFHYFLSLAPSFLVICLFVRKYPSFLLRGKLLSAVFICFFIRTSVLLIYYSLGGNAELAYSSTVRSLPLIGVQCLLVCFLVYIIEEITKNNRLQAELVNSEKVKIVGEIAASVAHEVRNPLTTVRGFIQMLGDKRLSEEKRRNYSAICLEELDRAQLIISDYLSLAKPENNHNDYFYIKDEFRYIANILGSYAHYRNVQIYNNIEEDAIVHGNRSKFRQAMINFGKNSIEAMPNGGSLEFKSWTDMRSLELYIIDTGIGMTSEQISRLGTPYYSTKEMGTGLGTMISYNIIRNMRGRVEVSSRVGMGTTYKITLPVQSPS